MKSKKILTFLASLAMAFTLIGCDKASNEADDSKTEVKAEQKVGEDKEETPAEEENKDQAKDGENSESNEGKSPIYSVKFDYLPENFVENFRDEKDNLLTVEYGEDKNPAKKITLQLSDNMERFEKLYQMPEDAEDIKIGDKDAKFWDDGSFRYVVENLDAYSIYARSTLDKDETLKILEEVK